MDEKAVNGKLIITFHTIAIALDDLCKFVHFKPDKPRSSLYEKKLQEHNSILILTLRINKPLQGMAPTECLPSACLLACLIACLLAIAPLELPLEAPS